MKTIIINSKEITTDENGRFSLNDLHKASGGQIRHLPNKFMASKSFNEVVNLLIAENSAFKPVVRKTGRYGGGTWICKELVYKYAMWVSASFEIEVIRTFDKAKNEVHDTMQALNELTKKIESDKDVASFCGKELAKYKRIKKENKEAWEGGVSIAQMNLGLIALGETK